MLSSCSNWTRKSKSTYPIKSLPSLSVLYNKFLFPARPSLPLHPRVPNTTTNLFNPFGLNFSLRASPQALSSLREKLFLLWGDLEELKSQAKPTSLPDQDQDPAPNPKSKPFECCLKEYGIRKTRNMAKADRASVDEEGDDSETRSTRDENYGWERRWRLWGTTIV